MCEINFDKQIEKIFSIKKGTVLLEFEKRIKQQSFDKKNLLYLKWKEKIFKELITLKKLSKKR